MRFLAALLLTALAWAAASSAPAQQAGKTEPEPRYDAAAVVDLTGTVVSVRDVPRTDSLSGIHVLVATDAGDLDAYLGPADFLKEFELTFARGETVQLVGSKVRFGGAPVLLVREVRKGDIFLYLRDRAGRPNWPPRRSPAT